MFLTIESYLQKKGFDGLKESRGVHKGGGKKKVSNLSSTEKIEILETEVSYLKAENDFLAKLRAKKSE